MAKSKLKVGTVLFKLQAALGDIAKDFCNHTPELMLICILIILQQLDYGMAYPAGLLNPQTLTYLSSTLILDNSYNCTIYSIWRFLYSKKIQCNTIQYNSYNSAVQQNKTIAEEPQTMQCRKITLCH